MNVPATIVVAVYLLGMLTIGWLTSKAAGRSVEDYWIAAGRTPFWLNFPAVIAIYISGGSFLGIAGLAYKVGAFLPTAFILGAVLGIGLSVVLTGAQFRRAGALTFADYMGRIFGGDRRVRGVAALMFAFYAFGYLVPQFQGGAVAFSTILGLPFSWAVSLMGVVVIVYVTLGGFWAVTWTDAIQGVLLFLSLVMLGVVAIVNAGGVGSLWSQVQQAVPSYAQSEGQLLSGIGLVVTWTFAWATFPAVVSRVFASQDEVVATRSLALGGLAYAIFHFFTIFVVAPAALLVAPGLEKPDFALIALMQAYLHPILIGVVVAGLLSALMSSADSLLMGATSALVHDLYIGLLKPGTSTAGEIRLSRAAVFVIGLLAVVLTINTPAIIGEVSAIVAGFAAATLFFPMVLGTWWRRATAEGVIAGMVLGAVVYIGAFYLLEIAAFSQVLYGTMASILGTVLVSLAVPRPIGQEREAVLGRVTAAFQSKRTTAAR